MGKRPILKNLTIEPIALSDKQHRQLDKIISSKKVTIYKHYAIRKVMINNTGSPVGYCLSCAKLPTHILKYHVSKVTLVQKYCENCLKKEGLIV